MRSSPSAVVPRGRRRWIRSLLRILLNLFLIVLIAAVVLATVAPVYFGPPERPDRPARSWWRR
ncbi:MAG: hypothetical protein H7144_17300 [Burkholderiales bacterium]|nr:hypothetical protein [Phycisphaerae bacterium]